ncbi:7-carboxy-7-deazaguanine synthase QueE [bacterium]|jgi:7-carboxy-7-deazaguanine synthase|nr:7-carboxy-7-deazaguanine synthase QueE [bacterium]
MTKSTTLSISESFLSIQGEGISAGVPALFLRLSGCNLTCGGPNTIKTKTLDFGATWRCDTIEVWTKGTPTPIDTLLKTWKLNGWIDSLRSGTHLVVTGGEPLLHDTAICAFLDDLSDELQVKSGRENFKLASKLRNPSTPKADVDLIQIEMETNGTLIPSKKLDSHISQYNVSPKLANSGMSLDKRYCTDVIDWFGRNPKSSFKFVIQNENDLHEIQKTYQTPHAIANNRILLMPAADNRKDYLRLAPTIQTLCKTHQYTFSPRLHIEKWDQKTGV